MYINSLQKDPQGIPIPKRRNGTGVAETEIEKAEEQNGQPSSLAWKVGSIYEDDCYINRGSYLTSESPEPIQSLTTWWAIS